MLDRSIRQLRSLQRACLYQRSTRQTRHIQTLHWLWPLSAHTYDHVPNVRRRTSEPRRGSRRSPVGSDTLSQDERWGGRGK